MGQHETTNIKIGKTMYNVTGIIEEVVNNGVGKGSGIVVQGIKYGAYDPAKHGLHACQVGMEVSFVWKENKQYKNLVGMVVPTGNRGAAIPVAADIGTTAVMGVNQGSPAPKSYRMGSFPIDPLDGQRSIIRQNSMTNAVNFVTGHFASGGDNGVELEDRYEMVLDMAKHFESFSAGDSDTQAVADLLGA